jgi:ABC-type Fe3+-hydroxamate transport system substrate-binding protein
VALRTSLLAPVALTVLVGCTEAQPWQEPSWRPAVAPRRVVAASVLAAESLLGVLPDERLAAAHAFAADPGYSLVADRARGVPLVGATPEQLLSVDPDLVLVDAYTRAETLALLAAAGVPVVRTRDPHGFDDIEANLRTMGRVTHLDEQLGAVATAMRQRLQQVEAAGRDLPTWRLMSLDGALHTYGEGSLFDAIARAAGATNVAAEHGVGAFRKLDIEEVLAWRPDAIVLAGEPGQGVPEWMQQFPGLDLLPCVQNERLLFVPGPLLSTTSHHLVEAAAFVQKQLREWKAP